MVELVLTTASSVKCVHGFGVTFTSTALTTVAGAAVVRTSDLVGAVFQCTAQQKCTSIVASQASATMIDTAAVVLAAGLTSNIGACTVIAGHDLAHAE
jgi:hypothetical protein